VEQDFLLSAVSKAWSPVACNVDGHERYLWLCLGLMVVETAVGLLGWYWHVRAIL